MASTMVLQHTSTGSGKDVKGLHSKQARALDGDATQ
jgi:hypothetical protein